MREKLIGQALDAAFNGNGTWIDRRRLAAGHFSSLRSVMLRMASNGEHHSLKILAHEAAEFAEEVAGKVKR